MTADWVKIRNKYINSTLSINEIAKKYGVSRNAVALRCRNEGWVEKRQKQQDKTSARLAQKSVENIANREAERLERVSKINDALLDNLEKAVAELGKTVLHNHRSKKIIDSEGGKRREIIDTTESISTVDCLIDIARAQKLANTLREIAEITALANNMPEASATAEDSDMVKAIRDAYRELNNEPK